MEFNVRKLQYAKAKIQPYIRRTRLKKSPLLTNRVGSNIFVKEENLQKTGSFKYRGATNFLLNSDVGGKAGIIAGSSGNHGIAVSTISKILSIPTSLCIPQDIPLNKLKKMELNHPKIYYYNRYEEKRELITNSMAKENNLVEVPSSDHSLIVEGAGTVGLEMLEDKSDLDAIFVPVGGGGLAAGVSISAELNLFKTDVIGVEPAHGNDMKLSVEQGGIVEIPAPFTIADGLAHMKPSKLPFTIIKERLTDVVTVTEEEIKQALWFAHRELKFMIEPSSALVIAAILYTDIAKKYKNIGIVLSGSNYNEEILDQILLEDSLLSKN